MRKIMFAQSKGAIFIGFMKGVFKKYFPILSASILILLVLFFILRFYQGKPYFISALIKEDISRIVSSLRKIDKTCNILSIENERNYVDFLNVKQFVSSEVGCLNLAYPENWRGPYIYDNPTLQGKLYEIVKTVEGVFVVPGNGVQLPNGFKLGKDILITYGVKMSKLLEDGGRLNYKGQPLAQKLDFKIGDWGREELRQKSFEEISALIKEFNQAMLFTENEGFEKNC